MHKYYDEYTICTTKAQIVACVQDQEQYWISISEDIFYPQAGGMESDRGTIGNLKVHSVVEKDGQIWLKVDQPLAGCVDVEIDWKHRLKNAQMHTAQHLLSCLVESQYGLKTLSHHVYEYVGDIEFEDGKTIDLMKLEDMANTIIRNHIPVTIHYPTIQELKEKAQKEFEHLEKPRVVMIGDLDYNLCGCIHVSNTSDLQCIQILRLERKHNHPCLVFSVGETLQHYFKTCYQLSLKAMEQLSTPLEMVNETIEKMKQNQKQLNFDYKQQHQAYVKLYANQLYEKYENQSKRVFVEMIEGFDMKDVQILVKKMMEMANITFGMISKNGDDCVVALASNQPNESELEALFDTLKSKMGISGFSKNHIHMGGGKYQEEIGQIIVSKLL